MVLGWVRRGQVWCPEARILVPILSPASRPRRAQWHPPGRDSGLMTQPSALLPQSTQQPCHSLPPTVEGHQLRPHVQEHGTCTTHPRVSLPGPCWPRGQYGLRRGQSRSVEGTCVSERMHAAEASATHDETSQKWSCAVRLSLRANNASEIRGQSNLPAGLRCLSKSLFL